MKQAILWEYQLPNGDFSDYDDLPNWFIEQAHRAQHPGVQVQIDDPAGSYTIDIDFNNWLESDLRTNKQRAVKRTDLTKLGLSFTAFLYLLLFKVVHYPIKILVQNLPAGTIVRFTKDSSYLTSRSRF